MSTAAVIGSGPNGLAAALVLADAGLRVQVYEAEDRIGGGTRSSELTPGLIHDECSAAHPLAVQNAFTDSFDLGIDWLWPEIAYAHPLDGGGGADSHHAPGVLVEPEPPWEDILGPVLHRPHQPLALARFAARAALPATTLARRLPDHADRALWAGVAAHSFRPLSAPFSSAIGIVLAAAAHRFGWPVARGGSAAITAAMAGAARARGATITTGARITALEELDADVVMLDTAPRQAATLAAGRLPAAVNRALGRFRYGPAAFKVDFAVHGGVPWAYEPARRAGTVHLGGSLAEIAHAEAETASGRLAGRPFVLVCQQYLADASRSAGDLHPVWSYAHVPAGYPGDASTLIEAQIERFAPGFGERVAARHITTVAQREAQNANYVGGDISTGANDPLQMLARPRPALNPYSLGIPGVYLCSAATPPGAGAHGMCGFHAAQAALRWLMR